MTEPIQNLTLYFPGTLPDVRAAFPEARPKKRFLGPVTGYTLADGTVLEVIPKAELEPHLEGFQGWAMQTPNVAADKWRATARIVEVTSGLGVVLAHPLTEDSDLYAQLTLLAFAAGGFVFVRDSLLTEEGFLVGPASIDESDPARVKARKARAVNVARLEAMGFHVSPSLPIDPLRSLRPEAEIRGRMRALHALVTHVLAGEDQVPEARLRDVVERDGLRAHLTPEESTVLDMPKDVAQEAQSQTIGWRFENIWPLAWAMGFEATPSPELGQLMGDRVRDMFAFIEAGETDLRTAETVGALEDLFYCAHNSVRSAQLGGDTVPEGYDPVADGGCVHERRHALTWMMSPDVAWEDTDLST